MRELITYDEVLKALKEGLGDIFDEKRFALESLAARIQEEVALYFRVQTLLVLVCEGKANEFQLAEYITLSKHSASLTSMILGSTKILKIEDKTKLEQIVNGLRTKIFEVDGKDGIEKETTTSAND